MSILFLGYVLGVPLLLDRLTKRVAPLRPVPPVLLCYGAGILLASTGLLPFPEAWLHRAAEVGVLLALPFLLFSTDLLRFLRSAPRVVGSFLLCVASVFVVTYLAQLGRGHLLAEPATVSGMLVGLYTGGTPDMNAVAVAAGAPESLIVYLNIADIVCGGVYFLLLLSVVPALFGRMLPAYRPVGDPTDRAPAFGGAFRWQEVGAALLLTVGIVGAAVGLTYLLTGALRAVGLLILFITTGSVLASLWPRVRAWRGTFETGDYLLLVFSLAIGSLADFTQIKSEALGLIAHMAVVLGGSISLHLLLARLFGLDRDTVILTSVAALYGPAFIGQVARVLGNRELVFGAIAASLVGYALGNYLGLLMIELVSP